MSNLVAFGVVVQHPEALVTEETRVARGKLVVGREPSAKSRARSTFTRGYRNAKAVSQPFDPPSDVDVADGTLLGGDPVLVYEHRVQLLVQAVVGVGQSITSTERERETVY